MIIAIDGPSGVGKTTLTQKLAEKFNLRQIETGAMYRAVALAVGRYSVDLHNSLQLSQLLSRIEISFCQTDSGNRVILDGEDVTERLRTPEIDHLSSVVSAMPPVRKKMVKLQRQMGQEGNVVMEGRDIGSNVFPNADVKIYLDADEQSRVQRRAKQLTEQNVSICEDELSRQINERDKRDSTRKDAPLIKMPDATVVDTTNLTIDEVFDKVCRIVEEKMSDKR